MKYVLAYLLIFSLFSCSTNDNKKQVENEIFSSNNKTDSLNSISPSPLTFFDSIARKYDFCVKQIRNYTRIDSIYYTGIFSDAVFTGDTIFNLSSGYKAGIIKYDDKRSCIYKFLLVYRPRSIENTDHMIIFSECDSDPSVDYITLQYRLLTDSTFKTRELFTPSGSDEDASQTTKKELSWKINSKGLIDSISINNR